MMKTKLIVSMLLLVHMAQAQVGVWRSSALGLPVYAYTGSVPVTVLDSAGKDAMLPSDPYFLLGNYRMTLFMHASGIFQFMTAERGWARINAAQQPNYGSNSARLTDNNKTTNLTGLQSLGADTSVKKCFGAGFARYEYQLTDGLRCSRVISVKPAEKINTGNPAFVVTVTLKNTGKTAREIGYSEQMPVNFVPVTAQFKEQKQWSFSYQPLAGEADNQLATVRLTALPNTFLVVPKPAQRYSYDVAPPTVFMAVKTAANTNMTPAVRYKQDTLRADIKTTLRAGETRSFHVVIGIHESKTFASVSQQLADLWTNAQVDNPVEGLFAARWKTRLPDLSAEADEVVKREMLWHAHVVEASAKYSAYYNETYIPQGSVYAYHFGDNISNRDHLQAALPACYTNPMLAKSSIRYVMKHTEEDGEIKRGNTGFGYTAPSIYKESDEQLFLFNTLAEYLLITKDYGFLNEQVAYYPAENKKADSVLNVLKKHFIYLRDEIGTGQHGLVKMLNSDWSDSFFHKYSPNIYAGTAESHLNTTMVLAIFPKLITALKQAQNPAAGPFIAAMENYQATIASAFYADFGDRKFAARAYLTDKLKFGLDNVCLEPQGYLLQIPDLPVAKKKEIYAYVKSKTFSPEQTGFRTREKPLWSDRGEGEDGGIWPSLEYPVLLGVVTFDKAEARALLNAFSFHSYTARFPQYWVGQWTGPDNINSSLASRQGLYSFWEPDIRRSFQGYCSHPHTWPLFAYFKLRESPN